MAKRYYNLEKETKAFLKRMEGTRDVLPDVNGIQRLNDYIVKRKGLGRIFSTRAKISQSFNGITNQTLGIPSNSSLQVKPSWEIVAWVYPKSAVVQEILSKADNSTSAFEFSLRFNSDQTFQHVFATGASYGETARKNAPVNDWYFLRLGRDASTNNVFISLNNDTPSTITQVTQAVSTARFNIGDWQPTGRPTTSNIDSIGRWDRVLTLSEYTFLYNSGRGVSFFEVLAYQPSLLTSLVSYWELTETSSIRYDWWGENHLTPNFTLLTTEGRVEKFF